MNAALGMVAFVVSCAPDAAASGLDLFGYGPRGSSMAGAIAATVEGHPAVYYNPAGLAFDRTPTFAFGYQRADFYLRRDGESHRAESAPATLVGFDLPIPFGGALTDRISLGFGFLLPTKSVLLADIPRPDAPHFAIVENRAQTVSLQVGLGVRIADWLAIGGGVLALSALDGAIDVAPNDNGRIGARVRDELIADYSSIAGVMIRATDTISVGLVYRDESTAEFTLPISAELGERFPIPVPRLEIAGTAQYDPRQITAEIGFVLPYALHVGAGGTWKQWSRYPNPIAYTAVPDDFPPQPEPNFGDTLVWRVGVERPFEVDGWQYALRVGYALEPTPTPDQTGVHNNLDSDRHLIAGGIGADIGAVTVELAAQWHLMRERTHGKNAELIAAAGFPEQTDRVRHRGRVVFWSVEIGVDL